MLRNIKDNPDLLIQLSTKPIVVNEKKKGKTIFGKLSKERELFKDDILKCKYAGYINKEIAEYFNVSKPLIDDITSELRQEWKKSIQSEDRASLLGKQIHEIDEIISDLKRDISTLKPKDYNLKLRYLTMLDVYMKERASLLGLKTMKLNLTEEVDPISMLIEEAKKL